jgi:hypothetical protein
MLMAGSLTSCTAKGASPAIRVSCASGQHAGKLAGEVGCVLLDRRAKGFPILIVDHMPFSSIGVYFAYHCPGKVRSITESVALNEYKGGVVSGSLVGQIIVVDTTTKRRQGSVTTKRAIDEVSSLAINALVFLYGKVNAKVVPCPWHLRLLGFKN